MSNHYAMCKYDDATGSYIPLEVRLYTSDFQAGAASRDAEVAQLKNELAAEQAKNMGLREWQKKAAKLVKHAGGCLWATPLPTGYGEFGCTCGYSDLVLDSEPLNEFPSDTSALEALIASAGEVMRERCIEDFRAWPGQNISRAIEAIRALPGVKLEDLK